MLERFFVWTGGAMFALSLLACAATYLITWSVDTPTVEWPALVVDVLLFTVFALHHSVFARESVKGYVRRVVPERLLRSIYVWTASLLLLIVLMLWQSVGGDVYHLAGWRGIPLVTVQLTGIWLIACAVAKIDALELAGIRPGRVEMPVQITGPYRLVRHPVYLGWLLAAFATPHLTGDRLAFAAISGGYLLLAVPWEERSLLRAFGEQYARYQRAVRWRVLPYVY
jgi:protein-S-isoprenylcysteine O-methyltransferase Ste14